MNRFYTSNREKVFKNMKDNSIAVFFAGQAPLKAGDEYYSFYVSRNFYYLTGIKEEDSILLLKKIEGTTSATIYIKVIDEELAKWIGASPSFSSVTETSGILDVKNILDFKDDVATIIYKEKADSLYLDLEFRNFKDNLLESQKFAKEIKEFIPSLNIINIFDTMSSLRAIKEDVEIEKITRASEITKNGVLAMMKNAKNVKKEYELEAYFDFELKKAGVTDFAFKSIVAGGVNAATLHYSKNNCDINENELILTDVGAKFEEYSGDITRTFPKSGKFTEEQKKFYNIVLNGNKLIINTIRPGIKYGDLNRILIDYYFEELTKIGFIKEKSEVRKYYFHNVSHFLGLETHDVGKYRDIPLEEGMVLTVEPGLYIPELNLGIRIEDDVLVTKDGCKVLTKDMIKEIDEIEKYMSE